MPHYQHLNFADFDRRTNW